MTTTKRVVCCGKDASNSVATTDFSTRFAFQCPRGWDGLLKLGWSTDDRTRFCRTCRHFVQLARTQDEYELAMRAGDCIAIEVDGGVDGGLSAIPKAPGLDQ